MMEVEPQSWRIEEIVDGLKPPYRVVRQANKVGDPVVGMLVPDTSLQAVIDSHTTLEMQLRAIADARESATTLAIEWFADAGLLSDFDEIMAEDVENLMGHVYAALGIEDALTERNNR